MNLNELAKKVTLLEGGKKQVSIAQIKEVIAILSDLSFKDSQVIELLIKNGKRRAK